MSYYSIKKDRIILNIKVNAGMRENKIAGIKNNELAVQVKAQAEKEKANRELIKYFAKLFGVSRSDIEIRSGEHSPHKIVVMPKSAESCLIAIAGPNEMNTSDKKSKEVK